MRFRKRIRDLDGIFQCFVEPQPLAPDHLIQPLARHVLHGDELDPARLGDVINVNDIGMVESRRRLGLLHETALAFRISDFLGRKNLDGDEPVQVSVSGFVHHAHPAAPKGFDNLVMQDGASDHGATRMFDTRVKLYRGSEPTGSTVQAPPCALSLCSTPPHSHFGNGLTFARRTSRIKSGNSFRRRMSCSSMPSNSSCSPGIHSGGTGLSAWSTTSSGKCITRSSHGSNCASDATSP